MTKNCCVCNKDITTRRPNVKFCGGTCRAAYNQYQYKQNKEKYEEARADKPGEIGRFVIFKRDRFRCIYCGRSSIEDGIKLYAEHVIPKSKNGDSTAGNLVTSCLECNATKSNVELDTHNLLRLINVIMDRNELFGIAHNRPIKLSVFEK